MSETADGAAEAAATTTTASEGAAGKTFTQEELDRIVGDRLQRERQKFDGFDDLKAKAEQFDELQRSKQTDLERLTGERDNFKSTAEQTRVENLRLRVALEKNLPPELIDRLHGASKEEMEADADKLLELVTPSTSFDGGPRRSVQGEQSMDALIRRAAGAS